MTDDMAFPLVEIDGPPRDRGRQYGTLAADRIAKSEEIYVDAMHQLGLSWSEVRALARDFVPVIATAEPRFLDEMRGIAEGAGVELETIVVVNGRSEIFNGRVGTAHPASGSLDGGCTGIVALPNATRDRCVLQAQNWDFNDACVQSAIVLKVTPETGPPFLTFVEAGGLARCGLNAAGITVTANNLASDRDFGRTGLPLSLIRRRILESASFAGALGAVTTAKRAVSNNMMIATADGEAVNLETIPDDVFPLWPDDTGILVHANHFRHPAALAKIVDRGLAEAFPSTLYRDRRVAGLLAPRAGDLTLDDLKAALADRFGAPHAVCRSPVPESTGIYSSTVATILLEPTEGRLSVCPAPYRHETYTDYRLSDPDSVTLMPGTASVAT